MSPGFRAEDTNTSREAEFAARFQIPTSHGSHEDLVADPDVDVVYVSTPHPFHHENALLVPDGRPR
ncbi:Gfo/Idh/MocA family oxidoreductase [Arthrobacter sp. 9MFCol3.1]|uniref:Gfo/Idh/MocA family oxidoreductase n=1 Tax=Arthrobacter sp. 9MFCol3.1 TaxID=1150398 RepID=UPI000A635C6D|nr:Gfo/Idh/MocA family oxidoreductase [Arthrobacter sp. 9MFCol3.1]